jgi:ABC-type Fe3+-hydroxamate transport system substrate-binding protein
MTLVGAARLLIASACAAAANLAFAALQVADDTGASVSLNTPARRIVSLAPACDRAAVRGRCR